MRQDFGFCVSCRIITYVNLKKTNAIRKAQILNKYLEKEISILDFGCGDLSMAVHLLQLNPRLRITGVDVVDFGQRYPKINFRLYNGNILPFSSGSFDTVIAYHVFHHAFQPKRAFKECVRVAKKKVIFVEPVYRARWEIPGMIFMDWLFNIWKDKNVPMNYNFKSLSWWKRQIAINGLELRTLEDVEILPKYSPTGRSYLFLTLRC